MVAISVSPLRVVDRCGFYAAAPSKRSRVYGSKTEAKRVLAEWKVCWPEAQIVPEVRS